MSISDRLDEIQERAKIARQVLVSGTTGVPPNVAGVDVYETVDILAESATDVPRLVAALRAVLAIDTEENRSVYGLDFEAGMCKALAIVHQTIDTHLGEGS